MRDGVSTHKLVLMQPQILQFRQLAELSRNETWGGVYKTQSKHTKKSHAIVLVRKGIRNATYSFILNSSQGKNDRVPVTWLWFNNSDSKFTNWPNSAGMGPGVYKTQSKHTKNKSSYPTGTKGHEESKPFPSYWMHVRGKRDGIPVSWFTDKSSPFKFANWPNSAGMGPGVYKTQSKHTKTSHPVRLVRKDMRKASLFLHIECKSG
jgi:hypothetical protein